MSEREHRVGDAPLEVLAHQGLAVLAGAALVATLGFACGARSTVGNEESLLESAEAASQSTVRANNATGPRSNSNGDSTRNNERSQPMVTESMIQRLSDEEALDELGLPRTDCGLTCAHLYASCPDAYDFDCPQDCEGEGHSPQFLECCQQEVFSAGRCRREARNGLDVRDCDDTRRCVESADPEQVNTMRAPRPLITQACQALCEYLGSQCAGEELRPDCPSECGAWAADLGPAFADAALCCAQRTFSDRECGQAQGGVGIQLCDSEARGCLF